MVENSDRIMFSSNNNTEQHPSVLNAVNRFRFVAKRRKKHDFAYSFLPIYYFSRFFGLMPFSFIYDSDGEIQAPRISIFDGAWFVISICIYVSAAFTNFQIISLPKEMVIASALYFGHYILLIQGLLVCAIAIGLDMCNRNKLVTILKTFIAFDKEVSGWGSSKSGKFGKYIWFYLALKISQMANAGLYFDYRKEFRRPLLYFTVTITVCLFFMWTTFFFSDFIVKSFTTLGLLHYVGSYLLKNAIIIAICVCFIVLLLNLYKRFVILNVYLR